MLQYLCNTQEGHLNSVYKIFCYLHATIHRKPGRMVFNGSRKDMINESIFASSVTDLDKCKDFYPEAHEALPGKPIEPLGNSVCVRSYVGANHAGNM